MEANTIESQQNDSSPNDLLRELIAHAKQMVKLLETLVWPLPGKDSPEAMAQWAQAIWSQVAEMEKATAEDEAVARDRRQRALAIYERQCARSSAARDGLHGTLVSGPASPTAPPSRQPHG